MAAYVVMVVFVAGMSAAMGVAVAQSPAPEPNAPAGVPSIGDKSRAVPGAHKGELGDKARPGTSARGEPTPTNPASMSGQRPPTSAPSSSAREPIDRTGAIVVPRENCGTWWSSWGNDRDANPCPANCERGERLALKESRDGGKVRYQVNYRCYFPELVVNQPSGAMREPGAPARTNCGTFWTARQSEPSTDANPCPANCERGELLGVKRGSSDGKSHYEMWYRCYVAEPRPVTGAPQGVAVAGGGTQSSRSANTGRGASETFTAQAIAMHGRWPVQEAAGVSLGAAAIQMTGRWPVSLAAVTLDGETIRMTGRWPLQSPENVSFTSGTVQMTGRWPVALAAVVFASDPVQMTGRWPKEAPVALTVTATGLTMTGRWPSALVSTTFTADPIRMTGQWPR